MPILLETMEMTIIMILMTTNVRMMVMMKMIIISGKPWLSFVAAVPRISAPLFSHADHGRGRKMIRTATMIHQCKPIGFRPRLPFSVAEGRDDKRQMQSDQKQEMAVMLSMIYQYEPIGPIRDLLTAAAEGEGSVHA